MRREVRKYIESELRHYRDNRNEISLIREDLVQRSTSGDQNRSSEISDPTAKNAEKLLTNRRLKKLEETVRAIEIVVEELDEDRRRLIEYAYFKRPRTLTDVGVARKIGVSNRTYYRWRDWIIYRIGEEMGLAD